jgi:hypothetical protein
MATTLHDILRRRSRWRTWSPSRSRPMRSRRRIVWCGRRAVPVLPHLGAAGEPPRASGSADGDIDRRIEEVIKVDQTDEAILREELEEYVVTDSIRKPLPRDPRSYWETTAEAHEGIAIWVSGFFGSGKSSFAKNLGLALAEPPGLGRDERR